MAEDEGEGEGEDAAAHEVETPNSITSLEEVEAMVESKRTRQHEGHDQSGGNSFESKAMLACVLVAALQIGAWRYSQA